MSNIIKYKRCEYFMSNKIDDEVVMMDLDKGKYYSLNRVASCVWDELETEKTLDEIVQSLSKTYDVTEDECTKKVTAFLDKMKQMGMVEIL